MHPVRISALAALTLFSLSAHAALYDRAGRQLPGTAINSPEVAWEILKSKDAPDFGAVGLIKTGPGWWCTGTIIRTGDSRDAPAYLLTAGHCADRELPGSEAIRVDKPARAGMTFTPNYFADIGDREKPIPVRKVAYATMKGLDIAVLELGATVGELMDRRIKPIPVSAEVASAGEAVENVGIPVTGVLPKLRYLHRSACAIGTQVNLVEGVYHWEGVLRNHCSSVGGLSGSPLIATTTGQIVAVQGTMVEEGAPGEPACALNYPCEVTPEGERITNRAENYSHTAAAVPTCFDAEGYFRLDLPGCALEKPAQP